MSITHTPGPWTRYVSTLDAGKIPLPIQLTTPARSICTLYADTGKANEWETAEANARLIAAAPDLLAALKAAEYSLAWHIEERGNGVAMDAKHLADIRAAIAKATNS